MNAADGYFHPVPYKVNDWLATVISVVIVSAVTHLVGLAENREARFKTILVTNNINTCTPHVHHMCMILTTTQTSQVVYHRMSLIHEKKLKILGEKIEFT